MLLDSNIVIYRANGSSFPLVDEAIKRGASISIVSRIEALGYTQIGISEKEDLVKFLRALRHIPVTNSIAEQAILLRQQRKMSLGDCIIAATALVYQIPLCTRNVNDFIHIKHLEIINPFEH